MDDKPGNVIDGTARARQWRRSRSKARADEDGRTDIRSDAPKSFASSLLVPADMVHGVLPPAAERETALDDGVDAERDETDGATAGNASIRPPERRNPFLSPEAAVVATTDPAKQRPKHRHVTALIARVITPASTSRGHRRSRLVAIPNRARSVVRERRIAGALGLGAVIASAAVFLTQTHDGSVRPRSTGGAQSLASLDRLRGIVLSVARPPVQQCPPSVAPDSSAASTQTPC